jgi:AraC family transcriptional regulator
MICRTLARQNRGELQGAKMTLRPEPVLPPEVVVTRLPSRPLLPEYQQNRPDLFCTYFRHPSGSVDVPGTPAHSLVINLGGTALINDSSLPTLRQAWAEAGCISLTPALQPVRRSWKGRPEVVIVFLQPHLLQRVADELDLDPALAELMPQLAVPDPALHELGRALLSEMTNSELATKLMVDTIAQCISIHLLRRYSVRTVTRSLTHASLSPKRFSRVVEFMQANLSRSIDLSELAQVCHLSPAHFSRAFKRAAGSSPHAYFVELRLKHAKELLEQTRMPITEIAQSCGFDHAQYFATAFRRKLGLTPTAWRAERAI